jgi:LysM repeat protein
VGQEFVHTVQKGQSLAILGARFGVEINVLAAHNELRPNALLKEGQTLLKQTTEPVLIGGKSDNREQEEEA